MTYVIKRDGRQMPFNTEKIKNAILKAFKAVDGQITDYAEAKAENIANYIEGYCEEEIKPLSIEEIQDLVENGLMSTKRKDVAKAYIKYREMRTKERNWNNEMMRAAKENLPALRLIIKTPMLMNIHSVVAVESLIQLFLNSMLQIIVCQKWLAKII